MLGLDIGIRDGMAVGVFGVLGVLRDAMLGDAGDK